MKKKEYRNLILYGVFGILTTLVNVVVYWLAAHFFLMETMPSTIFAWAIAVLFAYVTNRKWVFNSEENIKDNICKELFSFYICCLATGIVDWICMFLFVEV